MALSGTTMSLKKMAASTPYRRTGCSVISTTRSVRKHDSSIADALAHRAVLRQRPARLAHEPHRGVRHRLAPRRAARAGADAVRPSTQRVRRRQEVGAGVGHGR